jgi:hypothetical protein
LLKTTKGERRYRWEFEPDDQKEVLESCLEIHSGVQVGEIRTQPSEPDNTMVVGIIGDYSDTCLLLSRKDAERIVACVNALAGLPACDLPKVRATWDARGSRLEDVAAWPHGETVVEYGADNLVPNAFTPVSDAWKDAVAPALEKLNRRNDE